MNLGGLPAVLVSTAEVISVHQTAGAVVANPVVEGSVEVVSGAMEEKHHVCVLGMSRCKLQAPFLGNEVQLGQMTQHSPS